MRGVEITHPERIFFPKDKITKQELANYYESVAELMIPLIRGRPISMQRYPAGIDNEGFFQKSAPETLPSYVKTVKVERIHRSSIQMILCNDKKTLLWMANQGCITPHIWLSKADKPDHPDRLVFDLDPPPSKSFPTVRKGAFSLREILEEEYKLKAFVMTTGSKGLHIVVPIKRLYTFEEVRTFAKEVAQKLVDEDPKRFTLEMRKEKRKGRLYIDVMRNAKSATVVAPYAVRAIPGAPVATPLTWEELPRARQSGSYRLKTLNFEKNPWNKINRCAQSFTYPSHN